ncbi:MAG: Gfo/Idh/MocA family oxidoreductase [Thaumarchaeota archaeon]|nr:Gfo/Idh/MocA family oxidoreductase [Nitrososphaerota archaeon]
MAKKEIGVGVIGYGIGRVHAHAWKNLPLFYDLVATPKLAGFCARDSDKAMEMASDFGFANTYSEWKNLVKDPDISIIDNCAPPSLRLELCRAAVEEGKVVICEKPLARNADEAYEMYQLASRAHLPSMTGFTVRFAPAVMLAKGLIESGRLGKIFNIRCSYLNIISGFNGYLDPNFPFHWHFDRRLAGNGAISDLGSHVLDLVCYLLGDVTEVCGAAKTVIHERPAYDDPNRKEHVTVDDVAVASLRFKSGALGVVDASWMAAGKKDFFYFEVHGSEGSIRFNFERLTELEVYFKDESPQLEGFRTISVTSKNHPAMDKFWVDQGGGFTWNHLFVVELKSFFDNFMGEQTASSVPTFRDGYINSLLIDSIVESSTTGKWIKIEPKI